MRLLLSTHIVTAAVGIIAGAVALCARKGGWLHRRAGTLFVVVMVAMCGSGIVLAVAKGLSANLILGLMTAYLVVTAYTTVQPVSARSRRLDAALMLFVVILGLTNLVFAFEALASPIGSTFGLPPFAFFAFGLIGLLAGAGDLRMIRAGGLGGAQRLARHLSRMCWALFIATLGFFPNRARVAKLLPYPFTTPTLRVLPMVLVLLAMVYWLWRVRAGRMRRIQLAGAPSARARLRPSIEAAVPLPGKAL